MKRLLAGFIDVWKVLVVDPFRSDEEPIINLFDVGVLLGIASMLALLGGFVVGVAKIFP